MTLESGVPVSHVASRCMQIRIPDSVLRAAARAHLARTALRTAKPLEDGYPGPLLYPRLGSAAVADPVRMTSPFWFATERSASIRFSPFSLYFLVTLPPNVRVSPG